MATDETMQNNAFLSVFGDGKRTFGQIDILRALKEGSIARCGSEYLVSTPAAFDELFDLHTRLGLIERATPVSWRITKRGIEERTFQKEIFISPARSRGPQPAI